MWEQMLPELADTVMRERRLEASSWVQLPRKQAQRMPVRRFLAARLASLAAVIHQDAARSTVLRVPPPARIIPSFEKRW